MELGILFQISRELENQVLTLGLTISLATHAMSRDVRTNANENMKNPHHTLNEGALEVRKRASILRFLMVQSPPFALTFVVFLSFLCLFPRENDSCPFSPCGAYEDDLSAGERKKKKTYPWADPWIGPSPLGPKGFLYLELSGPKGFFGLDP
ncbi:hypothetical protein VNO77_19215 [Canavalia gladiata]|uniref:Uncharacterized protein n=1 Tax=Canavalia gladiata TaxID=3824 RepID=A0AAN9LMD0_CANGL